MSWLNTLRMRPYEEVDLRVPDIGMRPMPGKVCCLQHPKNSHSGIHLATSGSTSQNVCEDCGESVVEVSGLRWPNQTDRPCFGCGGKVSETKVARERLITSHQDPCLALVACSGIDGIEKGEVLVLQPEAGLFKDPPDKGWDGWDRRQLRILPGIGYDWKDCVLGRLTKDGFEPSPGWLLVEREPKKGLLETVGPKWANVGASGGERVVWDGNSVFTFQGLFPESFALVKSQYRLAGVA